MIKVLIIEYFIGKKSFLKKSLSAYNDIDVVGVVSIGSDVLSFVKKSKPDIIALDIIFPMKSAIRTIRSVLDTIPTPIIGLVLKKHVPFKKISVKAINEGVLIVVDKPLNNHQPEEILKMEALITSIKIYAQVKVIRLENNHTIKLNKNRNFKFKKNGILKLKKRCSSVKTNVGASTNIPAINILVDKKYIAIGVSSGGPLVLQEIFATLSEKFPYPIVVVQHMAIGFLQNMISWFSQVLQITTRIASNNELMLPGNIYFAPDSFHMGIRNGKIVLETANKPEIILPSVAHLFTELSKSDAQDTIAMLLTGMGKDGAIELKLLQEKGAVTIAQDEESSLVHGMPGEAIKLNGANYILNTNQIANMLLSIEENYVKKRIDTKKEKL